MLSVIPFSGLYNSVHDDALGQALNQMFSDERGNPIDSLVQRGFDLVDWTIAHQSYARSYVESFADKFKLFSIKFDELNSPREYNFLTDRIFVRLSPEDVRAARRRVPTPDLVAMAEDLFTSRSGFSSYYSNDIRTWGPLVEWDHNQVFCILRALVVHEDGDRGDWDGWREFDLMEHDQCNGGFDAMLEKAMCFNHEKEAQRLCDIAYYLRQREGRRWKIAA